jgi:hypothetical protein
MIDLKIVSIQEARKRYDDKHCTHYYVEVDEARNNVVCQKCGIELNPIWVLVRFAREETTWKRARDAAKEERERLEAKQRTKCRHCGEMTKIR